jgi:hypothetical protein
MNMKLILAFLLVICFVFYSCQCGTFPSPLKFRINENIDGNIINILDSTFKDRKKIDKIYSEKQSYFRFSVRTKNEFHEPIKERIFLEDELFYNEGVQKYFIRFQTGEVDSFEYELESVNHLLGITCDGYHYNYFKYNNKTFDSDGTTGTFEVFR